MKISTKVIENATANYLSLDELAFLYSAFFNYKWEVNIMPASLIKLKRLGYLDEKDELTLVGENVLFSCIEKEVEPTPISTTKNEKFDEIWMMFPKDDGYRHFEKSRIIRWNKAETKREYEEALKKVKHEDLVRALNNEVAYRKLSSTKENFFKYMKSSVNWFKTEQYNEFIDEQQNVEDSHGKELS